MLRNCSLSLVLAAGIVTLAQAQATSTGVHTKAGTPASPPSATSAPSQTSHTATSTASSKLPAGVMAMSPTAMITVGGKQVSAGSVQSEVKAQIRKAAGQPTIMHVASNKRPSVHLNTSMGHASASSTTTMGTAAIAQVPDCATAAPVIIKVQGKMTPGQTITLTGGCFGDQPGEVKLNGLFPAGAPQLAKTHWTNGQIQLGVPAVTGAANQQVFITIVNAHHHESPAKAVTFVATNHRAEVPASYWHAFSHFEAAWQETNDAPAKANTSPTQFDVTVNAACALDNMDTNAAVGRVTEITGWAEGPPNTATVQVAWKPQTTLVTHTGIVSSSSVFEAMTFDVRAWANCPAGIDP